MMTKFKSKKPSDEEQVSLYETDDGSLSIEDIECIREVAEPKLTKGGEDVARERRMRETVCSHITPSGGNIFLDLGFPPEEAARLLAESDKSITEKLRRNRR